MKNLKTIFGILMLAMTFSVVITACGDDKDNKTTDNCKPLRDQISALQADSTAQAQVVRNAIDPATAQPDAARADYDGNMAFNFNNNNIEVANIKDTAKFSKSWVYNIRLLYDISDQEKDNLYNASELFLNTCEQLEAKRAELTTCK